MSKSIRHALGQLIRHPGYTIVALLTLSLCIGANTAVFSVVDAVLLRPLPYSDAGRLVRLWSAYPARNEDRGSTSPQDLDDWKAQSHSIQSMGAWPTVRVSGLVTVQDGVPTELTTEYVTPGFFSTLGVPAFRGRTLTAYDHDEGRNNAVVLSFNAWRSVFGGDPNLVGRSLRLGGQPFTVVGIMPPGFAFPTAGIQAWAPLSLIPKTGIPRRREVRFLSVIGRLAPGTTLEAARREMSLIADRLSEAYPNSNRNLTAVSIQPLRKVILGPVRPAMLAIFGGVALVLLIGCVNVASLVLARSEDRSRELAIRVALGASRGALVRQLLTEYGVLAVLGGGAGLLLGIWATGALETLAPADIPRLGEVALSARVLSFTALLSVVTAVLFGLFPALRASRPDLRSSIGEGGRSGSEGRHSGRIRSALVFGEVALVAVLAVSAGLLVRSYRNVLSIDPGFKPKDLLTLRVNAGGDDFRSFLERALDRVRDIPGVKSAALARPLPLGPSTFRGETLPFRIPGRAAREPRQGPRADLRFVSSGFFDAMGIPLLAGRDFSDRDKKGSPPVVIVSQAAVRQYWDGVPPVGDRIKVGPALVEVIGVVDDIKQTRLEEEARPAVYVSFRQFSRRGMSFVIRTDAPAAVLGPVRKAIWTLRPNQPIQDVASMETLVSEATAGRRFSMALLTAFAALALLLAAVGIYGVVTYSVRRRVREIGIRIALGANPSTVIRLVMGRSLALVSTGVIAGLALTAAGSGLLRSLLFGVKPLDPWVFAGSAILLILVAGAATALPARRAARVDPLVSIRIE